MPVKPPLRTTHTANRLMYDRWGLYGRPVVLLHGLLFDRTMWWPVAAELATECTVIAPDLPGHGQSPVRTDYSLTQITWDLATLINNLGLHRAPIVVGHGTSAWLATAFADAFATAHTLTIDEPMEAAGTVEDVIEAAHVETVPEAYRPFAEPRRDPALLAAYASWFSHPPVRRTAPARLGSAGRTDAGHFPHLTDPEAFAAGIRMLL